MTKLQHTPGPWEVQEKCAYGYDIRSDYDNGWKWIAVAEGEHNGPENDWPDDIQSEANARLIAAAPEMLEELINFCAYNCTDCSGKTAGCSKTCGLKNAKAIIEKATGLKIEEVLSE